LQQQEISAYWDNFSSVKIRHLWRSYYKEVAILPLEVK